MSAAVYGYSFAVTQFDGIVILFILAISHHQNLTFNHLLIVADVRVHLFYARFQIGYPFFQVVNVGAQIIPFVARVKCDEEGDTYD